MPDLTLLQSDLTEQLALIQRKEISADELAAKQLALINQLNPLLNAFISVTESVLELYSPQPEGSLTGALLAVKDNIDVHGFATTAGLETRRHRQASTDAFAVARLRAAGARFSGKLNMHEGALGASNHNSHYGNCFNPHRDGFTPGGSSGGSGAAVAACLAPLALGSDTMGSVRIPASYCGVFGYKPSRGAVSNRGAVACSRIMDNIGPLTRSARDLLLVAKHLLAFDAQSAESIDYAFEVQACREDHQKPVILVPSDLSGLGVEASIIEDFERNLKFFEDVGCKVSYFDFTDYDFSSARRAGLIICEADMRVEHAEDWQQQRALFSPYLQSLLGYIDNKTPMDVMRAERFLERAVVKSREIFAQGDFILMPTTPQRAFAFEQEVPANQADLTSFANQAGLCAVSMPMLTDDPLPAGMQLVGQAGDDMHMLHLAEQWQQASQYSFQFPSRLTAYLEEK